ncbi:hypothetical protein GCM10007301_38090 [Azorhizobium oxalatiphilum]|uniref:Exonuclease n=1 Tax=Azorhizobium oxalatiphilum TaxID=980631 RepID=A0A917C6L2_9HYPH|nr:hypothetical protein [Azorhizobium oxalatiphilum]GGF74608.1 hypothetical protein GCM10007301_38090 [Azorhizobium oxalatiphilum]
MSENTKLTWPVKAIDFEASSLEDGSYPIEVGIAVWLDENAPVAVWSTLIRPTDDWRRFGHWSLASRRVHGITMSELADGMSALEVAKFLNEKLGGGIVWCDGGPYDVHWQRALFGAASIKPNFALGNWAGLLRTLPERCRERALAALEEAPPRHRAGADAEQLIKALAVGLAEAAS